MVFKFVQAGFGERTLNEGANNVYIGMLRASWGISLGCCLEKQGFMAIRTDSVARFICEAGDWRVTNLQLQKIMYFAQMICLGIEGERLVDSNFEAWDYGPVAPRVYRQVRMFGASPIRDIFFDARPLKQDSKKREILSNACRDLLPLPPGQLVDITHWKEGAWTKYYVPGEKGTLIPDAAIQDEFQKHVQAGNIQLGGS